MQTAWPVDLQVDFRLCAYTEVQPGIVAGEITGLA